MSDTAADFAGPASSAQLEEVAERLRERNFEVRIVEDGAAAREMALSLVPEGSEVHSAKSKTLEDTGILADLQDSGKYDFLRARLRQMDRETQAREMRKLVAAPDYELGSVQALTTAGQLVVVSASGSQIGPYAATAEHLILVVGSQKLVPDLDAALRRIEDYVLPYEDERVQEQLGMSTAVCKVLIMERDYWPGRTTVVLVREPVGY